MARKCRVEVAMMPFGSQLKLGVAFVAALALTPLHAQNPAAPPPPGLKEGTGAPFPKGQASKLDALPDWGGIWFMQRSMDPASRPAPPKLKGKYKAANDAWRAGVAANNGVTKNTRSNCAPPGMPGFMQLAQYPYEFLFTPGRVTINQEAWRQTRKIWTDGRAHQEDPDPSYTGDSVGRWEGGTLVAETIGIKEELPLQGGASHSARMKITERIHLSPTDANILLNEITVEDPEALEEPWKVTVTYRRDRYGMLYEFECSENDRNPVDEEGNTQFN
jgi:hypothetical protein